MSVSVRSNTNRLSAGGHALRSSAHQQLLSSRHSNTDTKFNTGRRTSSHLDNKGNTAVITIDELQRIRAQCTQGSSFTGTGASYMDMEDEAMRTRERIDL